MQKLSNSVVKVGPSNLNKKRTYLSIGILALVFCITGATFAYFTAIATSNNISGNMASVNIDLNIEKITHVDEEKGGLIPMSNNMVEVGINNNCIDNNGNAVCQIYKITTTNTGSTNLFLDGYITLTGGSGEPADYTAKNNNTTMRWAQVFCNEGTNCTTVGNTTTGATGIDSFITLDNMSDKTGLNQDNIKSNYNDVIGNGTIQDSSYDVINKNYIRVSDHDTSSTNYDRKKDVTSALVYNQQLDSSTGISPSRVYYFVVWLSENGHNQTQIITDKFFGGIVTFMTASGNITGTFGNYTVVNSGTTEKVLMADYIKDLYNDGSNINTVELLHNYDEWSPKVYLNATQNLMLDNNGEYRYYGANPNNYVSFNNELWRIISVSNVKSSEDDTVGEERVKLIRDESIGEYSYSYMGYESSVDNYSRSTLKTVLNDYYYNALNKQSCYDEADSSEVCNFSEIGLSGGSKNQIDSVLWYVDNSNDSYADYMYDNERNNNENTWEGKIAIMYPSDYAYATDLSQCYYNASDFGSYPVCNDNNWLLRSGTLDWLLNTTGSGEGLQVTDSGMNPSGTSYGKVPLSDVANIRPTVYLKSSISITGGDGSKDNPYTLSNG